MNKTCCLHLAILSQLTYTVVYDAFNDHFPAVNIINIAVLYSRAKLHCAQKTSYTGRHVECHTVQQNTTKFSERLQISSTNGRHWLNNDCCPAILKLCTELFAMKHINRRYGRWQATTVCIHTYSYNMHQTVYTWCLHSAYSNSRAC